MKIFHRVLAVVLALILTVAVLPLGVFASEKPWFEVESETQSPNGTDTDTKIVVKLDAKQLLKLVQDTGVSSELLNKLKECISIDTKELMNIINMDQLTKLIPLELIPFTEIIAALGKDVDLYFDLEKLLGGLTADQLEDLAILFF